MELKQAEEPKRAYRQGINRTFMELKPDLGLVHSLWDFVLIEPLWN